MLDWKAKESHPFGFFRGCKTMLFDDGRVISKMVKDDSHIIKILYVHI